MRGFAAIMVVLVALVACKKKEGASKPPEPVAAHDAAVALAPPDAAPPPAKEIVTVLPADLKWVPFDEKAGIEKSGGYAVAFGDPQTGPTGLFIKLPAGNPGMPHTHTNSYHGVSITGGVTHQQDGKDKAKPLPPGSYWFEPGGAPHTSACPGKQDCLLFVHFNDGKFDFAPSKLSPNATKNEKYVEVRAADMKFAPLTDAGDKGPMIKTVWSPPSAHPAAMGDPTPDPANGPHGTFWKFPGGFTSPPHTHSADYHAVIIKGTVLNYAPDDKSPKELGPGAYYMQPAGGVHITACKAGSECLLYSYMTGAFDFVPVGGAGSASGGGSAAGATGSAAGAGSAAK